MNQPISNCIAFTVLLTALLMSISCTQEDPEEEPGPSYESFEVSDNTFFYVEEIDSEEKIVLYNLDNNSSHLLPMPSDIVDLGSKFQFIESSFYFFETGHINKFDLISGESIRLIRVATFAGGALHSFSVSPDEKNVAYIYNGKSAKIINLENDNSITLQNDLFTRPAIKWISPTRVLFYTQGGVDVTSWTYEVYDLETGTFLDLPSRTDPDYGFAWISTDWSSDGNKLLFVEGLTLRLFDAITGETSIIDSISNYRQQISSVQFSPNMDFITYLKNDSLIFKRDSIEYNISSTCTLDHVEWNRQNSGILSDNGIIQLTDLEGNCRDVAVTNHWRWPQWVSRSM